MHAARAGNVRSDALHQSRGTAKWMRGTMRGMLPPRLLRHRSSREAQTAAREGRKSRSKGAKERADGWSCQC
eukprot:546894-Rhodomonas_salina.2